MQSYRRWIALLAVVFAGSAYGSSSVPTQITRSIGEDFEASVITLHDVIDKCHITTPSMENIVFIPNDESDEKYELQDRSDVVGCRVRVLDLNVNDTGLWTIHTVSSEGTQRSHSYNVTVNSPTEPDTPEKPTPEVNIVNLDEIRFDTKLGATHRVQIPYRDFVNTEGCYIITPEEDRVNFETRNISGIEIINDQNVACGVILSLEEEAQIGQWFLISRETRLSSEVYERRLPFSIHVTEEVNAIPNEISVVENKNLYVRLENAIPNPETCKLLRPDGSEYTNYETDPRYNDTCGFVVRNVTKVDSGTWRIEYGDRITYIAPFNVTVNTNGAQSQDQPQFFTWTRDKPVQEIVGSEDAIYCKIIDPKNFVVFEGFGRCNITLPRATNDHQGNWTMFVGLEGRVLTEESTFTVQVVDGSPKAEVTTQVALNQPIVTLTCSVSSPHPIRACKFRDPSGRILMANPGVGEDRYTFHGEGSSYNNSGVYTHDCGIQITNPVVRDLGIWRCAIETNEETYFGFLTVWCPWVTKDPEVVAGILTVPILMADRTSLEVVEGDDVLMSCSVQSAIRYCYFRASNGTVYNVGPGFSSTDMADYAGAGLDAGECSIRFRSLSGGDSRGWSCHVGFPNHNMPEQRATFAVNVKEIMEVTQTPDAIRVAVEGSRQLDYCRFVRIDGLGFTSDAVPAPYVINTSLNTGNCTLWLLDSSILDRNPWTVVTRITGHSEEMTKTTNGSLVFSPRIRVIYPRLHFFWFLFLTSGIILIVVGVLSVPKKNRNWTYQTANSMRNSFRHRFARNVVAEKNISDKNTANAA